MGLVCFVQRRRASTLRSRLKFSLAAIRLRCDSRRCPPPSNFNGAISYQRSASPPVPFTTTQCHFSKVVTCHPLPFPSLSPLSSRREGIVRSTVSNHRPIAVQGTLCSPFGRTLPSLFVLYLEDGRFICQEQCKLRLGFSTCLYTASFHPTSYPPTAGCTAVSWTCLRPKNYSLVGPRVLF